MERNGRRTRRSARVIAGQESQLAPGGQHVMEIIVSHVRIELGAIRSSGSHQCVGDQNGAIQPYNEMLEGERYAHQQMPEAHRTISKCSLVEE